MCEDHSVSGNAVTWRGERGGRLHAGFDLGDHVGGLVVTLEEKMTEYDACRTLIWSQANSQ